MTEYYSDIYECIENDGDIMENTEGMTLQELFDFFGDVDIAEFL